MSRRSFRVFACFCAYLFANERVNTGTPTHFPAHAHTRTNSSCTHSHIPTTKHRHTHASHRSCYLAIYCAFELESFFCLGVCLCAMACECLWYVSAHPHPFTPTHTHTHTLISLTLLCIYLSICVPNNVFHSHFHLLTPLPLRVCFV